MIKDEQGPVQFVYNRIYGLCPQCMPPGVLDSLHVMKTFLKNSFVTHVFNDDNVFTLLARGYLKGQDSLIVSYLYASKIGEEDFGQWKPEKGWEYEIREFRGKRVQ
jgi:hypothetical protein